MKPEIQLNWLWWTKYYQQKSSIV